MPEAPHTNVWGYVCGRQPTGVAPRSPRLCDGTLQSASGYGGVIRRDVGVHREKAGGRLARVVRAHDRNAKPNGNRALRIRQGGQPSYCRRRGSPVECGPSSGTTTTCAPRPPLRRCTSDRSRWCVGVFVGYPPARSAPGIQDASRNLSAVRVQERDRAVGPRGGKPRQLMDLPHKACQGGRLQRARHRQYPSRADNRPGVSLVTRAEQRGHQGGTVVPCRLANWSFPMMPDAECHVSCRSDAGEEVDVSTPYRAIGITIAIIRRERTRQLAPGRCAIQDEV